MSDGKLTNDATITAEQKIHPIVEFFAVDYDNQGIADFIDTSEDDRKLLRTALKSAKGIYAFYNSEYEIIYLGKTKYDLWTEMKNAFNREMNHYVRYKVSHPRHKYVTGAERKVRPIRNTTTHLYDCAAYFSAYAIEDDTLIDLVELMMIRLCPNDLVNVRIEGNTLLRPYDATGKKPRNAPRKISTIASE